MINEIIHGDCMCLLDKLDDNYVEMTLTDIPYGVVSRTSNGLRNLDKDKADIETFILDDFLLKIIRVSKGSIYVFCSTEQVSFIRDYFVKSGLSTRLCIWEKSNPSPLNGQHIWLSGIECCVYAKKPKAVFNEFCKNTVWRFPTVRSKLHPTQKSLELFKYLIKSSSNADDIILDPCCGSGTTALAAKLLNRRFVCFESDENYAKSARERLSVSDGLV